jgi:multiple sugar transport system permease protein
MHLAVSSARGRSRRSRRRAFTGLLFVLPAVCFTAVFFVVPLAMTVWMSLNDWPLLGRPHFTGLGNYLRLLHDRSFWSSLLFTAEYTLAVTPPLFLVAFGLALLVQRRAPLVGAFRTAYFLPVVIGMAVASLLWVWLLNDQVGVVSDLGMRLGLLREPLQWLDTTGTALSGIVAMVLWKASGFTMVLLLVGMQAIPEDLLEAARIDGASWWQRTLHVTLPLLRRTFALALVISIIGSFLAFEQFFILTHGGPRNTTISVVYWIYRAAFTSFRLGYAAAMSVILLLILVLLSVLQLWLLRDEEA